MRILLLFASLLLVSCGSSEIIVEQSTTPTQASQETQQPSTEQNLNTQFTVRLTEEIVEIGGHTFELQRQTKETVTLLFDEQAIELTNNQPLTLADGIVLETRTVELASDASISFTITLTDGQMIEASLKQGEQAKYQVGSWSATIKFVELQEKNIALAVNSGQPVALELEQEHTWETFSIVVTELDKDSSDQVIELTIKEP